jgi:hypothetical protein
MKPMRSMLFFLVALTVGAAPVQAQETGQPSEDKATTSRAARPSAAEEVSHYEHLKELEWMIGEWVDEGEEATITTVCKWTKNRNFMTRSFTVTFAEGLELEGTQVVGWDPVARQIRSWMFDSEGGFGQGRWTRQGNRWVVKASQVLKGGRRASAINVLTYVDQNTFTWQSIGREIAGELQPNVPEVTIVRKQLR